MNCKPGDLAIALTAVNPENVGTTVEVLSAFGVVPGLGLCWSVRSARPTPHGLLGVMKRDGVAPDEWLRPIAGVPDEEVIELPEDVTSELAAV